MPISDLIFEPRLNVSPNRIVSYTHVEGRNTGGRKKFAMPMLGTESPRVESPLIEIEDGCTPEMESVINSMNAEILANNARVRSNVNLTEYKYKRIISHAAKKRISSGINWLYAMSDVKKIADPTVKVKRFRLSMITLTLPSKQLEIHNDEFIKKYPFNRFLEQLRRKHAMQSYLWRAEAQENNNIHFHLTTNVFVHHTLVRKYWNDALDKYGYIDAFEAKHGHRNAPTEKVHSIYKIRCLAAYLCKYMCKDVDSKYRPIDGRQWFLSQSLSSIKPIGRTFVGDLREEIERYTKSSRTYYHKETDPITGQEKLIAIVFYADVFSGNLKHYPLLYDIKQEAIKLYHEQINDKPMTLQILTAKCYQKLFNCSLKLAKKMIAEDRTKLKVKRLNPRLIMDLHGLNEGDFAPLFA